MQRGKQQANDLSKVAVGPAFLALRVKKPNVSPGGASSLVHRPDNALYYYGFRLHRVTGTVASSSGDRAGVENQARQPA
jgi:predicted secreted hydrolase